MQPPQISLRPQPRLAWLLGSVLVLSMALAVLFLFNPSHYSFYPRCMLYVTTGIYCPGCGSQRALYQLVHGHLAAALRCNLLLILSLPYLAFTFARYSLCWLAHKPLPPFVIRARWLKLLTAVLIVFAIHKRYPLRPVHLSGSSLSMSMG